MTSSLEIFDTKTMEHIGTHSFGVYVGSFTRIDRSHGDWYLMFVHYENEAQDLGRGAAYTTLVQMDSLFRRKEGWTLPPEFTDHLKPMSVSGGTFISDDILILSPHHFPEVYKFRIPKMGYHLEWIETLPSLSRPGDRARPFKSRNTIWHSSQGPYGKIDPIRIMTDPMSIN